MDDTLLRQLVTDELDYEPSIDAAHIGVAVDNGVVTLSGHVDSYAQKLDAERAALRVKGVRAVAQQIDVRYPADKKTHDDEIAGRAAKVVGDARVPEGQVKVSVQKGWVTLAGTVEWQYQKLAAEAAVRKLSGVTGVSNSIEVKPRVHAADVKERILAALHRNADLEGAGIRVTVLSGRVILDGSVKAWHERALAERAAWAAPGVKAVEDRLTVD